MSEGLGRLSDRDKSPVIIFLENGFCFKGNGLGISSQKPRFGEFVFCTSMTGIEESLTDPSFARQIYVSTAPHIGNTGYTGEDKESARIWTEGLVCRHLSFEPSNWRAKSGLPEWILSEGAFIVYDVDTRLLTETLRDHGSQRGIVLTEPEFKNLSHSQLLNLLNEHMPPMAGADLTGLVTCQNRIHLPVSTQEPSKHQVGVWDFGCKANTIRILSKAGCDVTVFPATTKAEDLLSLKLSGLVLSNGPGDPAAATYLHQELKKVIGKVPIFSICLGHQLLAHALGGKTYKMKFGHRGIHHPVLELAKSGESIRTWITSQNHGFAVDIESLPKDTHLWFVHADDGSCEGFSSEELNLKSVQFHPESCPGPRDAEVLFSRFLSGIGVQIHLGLNSERDEFNEASELLG